MSLCGRLPQLLTPPLSWDPWTRQPRAVTGARVTLGPARAIGVLVRNLCVSRELVEALGGWTAPSDPALPGLDAGEFALLPPETGKWNRSSTGIDGY